MLLADLDQVDGPGESRLIWVRGVASRDDHSPGGIEPALELVVDVLAAHVLVGHKLGIPEARRNVVIDQTAGLH